MTNVYRLIAAAVICVCTFFVLAVDDAQADDDNYGYVEFGAGVRLNGPWIGDYPSYLETGYVWGNVWKKSYVRAYFNHSSNIERGAPRNDKSESYLDQAGFAIGWRF